MNVHKDRVFGRERAMRRTFPGLLRFSGQTPRKAFAPLWNSFRSSGKTVMQAFPLRQSAVMMCNVFLQNTCINREER